VGVLPTYRRRGIMGSLMRRQLSDIRERAEPIAALLPTETPLYGRFGYGLATRHASFTIRRGEGALTPDAPSDPAIRRRIATPARDDLLAGNAGHWHLQAADSGAASCERTAVPADISLNVRELGAAYLGGTRIGSLATAGLVTEHRPGTLARLSAAMSWDPSPWCPGTF
jgi:predicted acetyltransferase